MRERERRENLESVLSLFLIIVVPNITPCYAKKLKTEIEETTIKLMTIIIEIIVLITIMIIFITRMEGTLKK